MAALAEYVDFASLGYRPSLPPPQARGDRDDNDPLSSASPAISPRKGMTRAEAESAYGPPVSERQRREGGLTVTMLRFESRDQQIVADFVEDVLVRFSMSSR
jgi:hypothetical protein